ncbi:MAG: transcriptional regulator, partial [Bacteroidetes bacterium]
EVQIWPDKIEILSFPGPVPPVAAQIRAENKRIVARDYRNRRVGDFLKELHLTEGRGTGIPTMYKKMKDNGSPEPIFDTDEECTYFLTVLPVNPEFLSEQESAQESNQESNQVSDQVSVQESAQESAQERDQINKPNDGLISERTDEILLYALTAKSRKDILTYLGLSNHFKNYLRHIEPLIELGWLSMTHPQEPKHRHQKYITTLKGKEQLENTTR